MVHIFNVRLFLFERMFKAHPESLALFPKFASAQLNSLEKNPEFQAYGNMLIAGLDFMVDNLADTKIISQMLVGKPWKSYFSPNVSITQQLEVKLTILSFQTFSNSNKIVSQTQETARVFLEALDEEMGAQGVPLVPRSREIWTRALAHLNAAQAASFQ